MADFSSADLNIGEISIRFSGAMVTTALGMAVRVFFVTFSEDEDSPALAPSSASSEQKAAPEFKEVSPGSPMAVVLEVTASNLSAFNQTLSQSCNELSRARAELLSLAGGIKKDLEVANAETQNAIQKAQKSLEMSAELFGQSLNQMVEQTSEKAEATLQTCRGSMRAVADDAMDAMKKSAGSMTTAFSKAESGISAQVDHLAGQVEESTENMKQASEKLSRSIKQMAQRIESGELAAAFDAAAADVKASSAAVGASMKQSAEGFSQVIDDVTKSLDSASAVKDMGMIAGAIKNISRSSDELKASFDGIAQELKRPLYKKLF